MTSERKITEQQIRECLAQAGVDSDSITGFVVYCKLHPYVWPNFERIAYGRVSRGLVYGAKAIMEQVRFHIDDERLTQGRKDQFKINNDFTSYFARLFVLCYPRFRKKLKFRKVRGLRRLRTEKGQQSMKFRAHRNRFRRAA